MASENTELTGAHVTIDGIDRTADAGAVRFSTPNVTYTLNDDEPDASPLRAVGPAGFVVVFTDPHDSFGDLIDGSPHGLTLRVGGNAITVVVVFGGQWVTKGGARRVWATLDHGRHAVPAWSTARS